MSNPGFFSVLVALVFVMKMKLEVVTGTETTRLTSDRVPVGFAVRPTRQPEVPQLHQWYAG